MISQVADSVPDFEPQPPIGKDARGRFVQGNKGGPGNPFGRQVALLRSILLRASTEERMGQLIEMLWTMALDGNLAAVKLILQYTLGKPAASVDPDRIEIDDWRLKKENAVLPAEMLETPLKVMAETSSRLCERMWPAMESETLRPFKESVQARLEQNEQEQSARRKRETRRAAKKQAATSAARVAAPGERSAPPSPIGFFAAPPEEHSCREGLLPHRTAARMLDDPMTTG